MPKQLAVMLTNSNNRYLTYPCPGLLELFELSTDGRVIVGVFRQYMNGVQRGGPVVVREPQFCYAPEATRKPPKPG
jgi:hypothetical protein